MELLKKQNILINQEPMEKNDIVRKAGQMLLESGYVKEEYIDGMLKREEVCATNIGNGIAIPHGIEECKQYVENSGIVVLLYPGGVTWNSDQVKLVVGIAGKGSEHLEILANIAGKLSEPDAVENLVKGDVDFIYETFTTGEE